MNKVPQIQYVKQMKSAKIVSEKATKKQDVGTYMDNQQEWL